MKEDVKQKWLAALRSDRYTQGREQLVNHSGTKYATFCCLGVLTDVAVLEGVCEWDSQDHEGDNQHGVQAIEKMVVLPRSVMEWAGLTADPYVYVGSDTEEQERLSNLNDQRRYSFGQIADAIERSL